MRYPGRTAVRVMFIVGGVSMALNALMDGDMERAKDFSRVTMIFTAYFAWVAGEEGKDS